MKCFIYIYSKLFEKLRASEIYNSNIHKTSKIEAGNTVVNSIFGKHLFCGYDCEILDCDVDLFVSIASGGVIGGGMHPIDWIGISPIFYSDRDSVKTKTSEFKRDEPQRTCIGHAVWLGHNVIIKKGVSIGSGAVVCIGSLVTKDVEPYAIVGDTPVKLVNYRFNKETVKKLLEFIRVFFSPKFFSMSIKE